MHKLVLAPEWLVSLLLNTLQARDLWKCGSTDLRMETDVLLMHLEKGKWNVGCRRPDPQYETSCQTFHRQKPPMSALDSDTVLQKDM